MLTAAEFLAGLGLLFVGLRLVSQHLQQATGRRVRRVLQRATRSGMTGFFAGCAAGAATQSSNAVTLIAGNLVRGGSISVRDALPVIAGANVGTAALVFLASVDFRLAVLYLVALVGFGYQLRFDRHPRRREWTGVALGLALLFLGLDFIKGAPEHLDPDWLRGLLAQGLNPLSALLFGAVLATLTQSASAATILAVAATHAGMLALDDGMWLVIGANVGSGVAVMLAGSGLTGSGRQLCIAQVVIKLVGSAVVASLWLAAERGMGWSVTTLGGEGGEDVAPLLSVLFLVLQLTGGLIISVSRSAVERQLIRVSPPSLEERASRPHFIHEAALADPTNALGLAELERNRLIGLLPRVVPDLDDRGHSPATRRAQLEGNAAIALETEAFLIELIDQHLHRDDLHLALRLQDSITTLHALHDTTAAFAAGVERFGAQPPAQVFGLSESLRTLCLLLADAVVQSPRDPEDFMLLARLTSDRGEVLERLRRDLANAGDAADTIRRLLAVTSQFERAVWLIGRLSSAIAAADALTSRDAPG